MHIQAPSALSSLEDRSEPAAELLRAMANPRRLVALCKLAEHGEMTVTDLAREVGISQSALSQHLAKMRSEGIVAYRRDSQTLWYRLADPRCETMLAVLHDLFCKPGS